MLLERESTGRLSDVDARILGFRRSGYLRDARGRIHIEGTEIFQHHRFLNFFKAIPFTSNPGQLLRIHAEQADGALIVLSSPRKAVNGLTEPMLVDSFPLSVTAASLETFEAVVAISAPLGIAVESSLLVGTILASWVGFAGVVSNSSGRRH